MGGFRPGQYRKRTVYTPVERAKLGELREDLAGVRQAGVRALPAASSRASVVDMLRAAQ